MSCLLFLSNQEVSLFFRATYIQLGLFLKKRPNNLSSALNAGKVTPKLSLLLLCLVMPLNQEDLSCKLLHKRRPVAVNSCIVIRGNNFGLPPLVMQQGWIVCHHTTQHQHAGASVLTPLLCLHALFGHLLCRLQEFLSHSQLPGKSCLGHFEVNCSSAAEMAPVSKATVPSPGFKRSHRKLPISLVSSCCRSTSPPVKLSFAGLFIPVMSRQGATGGLCCSP